MYDFFNTECVLTGENCSIKFQTSMNIVEINHKEYKKSQLPITIIIQNLHNLYIGNNMNNFLQNC